MKKIILLLAFCLSVGNLFAQDANADKLREEGDAAMTAKNYPEVVAKYSEYLKLTNYEDESRIFNCAFAAYNAKKYDDAIKFYDMAIQKGYKADDAYVGKAMSLRSQDKAADFTATVEAGYEGIVIYNTDSIYQFNQRSSTVLKYKPVADAEYKILSYTADRNGHPVFTCETHDGKQFKVKPKGTDEERKQIITNFDSQYKIYENLTLAAEMGFVRLDLDKDLWKGVGYEAKENNFKGTFSVGYKF